MRPVAGGEPTKSARHRRRGLERENVLATVLALAVQAYATTAGGAAIGALYADPKNPPVVERINVVGPYATVLTRGGRMEGSPVTEPILVERFSFGWQALETLDSQCSLGALKLGRSIEAGLMRGMPQLNDDRPCKGGFLRDAGPRDEVEAIRRMMRGPLVPFVVVSGDWAMGEWYGGGGGESLYRKNDGRWQLVKSGGGAMGVDLMKKYGVPQSAWCKFGVFDAKCP